MKPARRHPIQTQPRTRHPLTRRLAHHPLPAVAAPKLWIIRWRKSAIRFLEGRAGFELVDPAEATTFISKAAAIFTWHESGDDLRDLHFTEQD